MPKLTPSNGNYINVPLSQIHETGNVRKNYDEEKIQQLANSILKNGLLNPLTVKRLPELDEYGNAQFELVCGHRRKRALEYLCSTGNDFNNVTVFIKQGAKSRMQLIENIQREDLSPEEVEAALRQMIDEGMTQTEIALETSKSLSWVSDSLAGAKVRDTAEAAGINTDGLGTKALSQLRSIPQEEIPAAVNDLKEHGGTVKKATEIQNQKKLDKAADSIMKEPKPVTITVEKAIEIILDYRSRMTRTYSSGMPSSLLYRFTNDIIALFRSI